ncbi:DUF3592 domain-containing protein [Lysobacter enzymogenes]|uniref:DUF3592 domain-containing protein n=1 Tax=Lysobacter enzymogenes TaxID=69 RepID=UPI001AF7C97F|nr:DUF3592 domain-containing protein [Lysobacter enzymogenes]QQQ01060.1 hypothetical protein JHW41_23860 [Lysobacter enzymogenes]
MSKPALANAHSRLLPPPDRLPLGLWLLSAACAAGWVLCGYSLAGALAQPPDAVAPGAPLQALLWSLLAGGFGGIIFGVFVNAGFGVRFGLAVALQASLALAAAALAAGFALARAWPWHPQAALTGLAAGWPQWLFGDAPRSLPAASALIALLLALGALVCLRRYRERSRRIRDLLAHGVRVAGTVVHTEHVGTEVYNPSRVRVVVRFNDHDGAERRVAKIGDFDPRALPRAGERVLVWFYPDAAGDAGRIVVGFGERPQLSQALG